MTKSGFKAVDGKPFIRLGGGEIAVGAVLLDTPPEYLHDFKREIYSKAAGVWASRQAEVVIRYARNTSKELSEISLRPEAANKPEIVSVPHFFRYDDSPSPEEMNWYLNFADPLLFTAYDTDLFAQDEIQTLEHPLLAALKLHLDAMRCPELRTLTVEDGRATPWIFENVPRWINVNTSPVDKKGKTKSIYGNAFASAARSLLRRAITINDNPLSRSNLIAMAAPCPGYGVYRPHEICQLLSTVLAGFAPAVEAGAGRKTVIHTGRWGAGAFGGSEELALCVQIIGGMLCGVSKLVFHAVSPKCLENARRTAKTVVAASGDAEQIVEKLLAREYRWGFSDGN